jgi:hypothetical protein
MVTITLSPGRNVISITQGTMSLNAWNSTEQVYLCLFGTGPKSQDNNTVSSKNLNLVHWRKMLQVVVTLVCSREQQTEIGGGFSGVWGRQEGSGRQRGRYRWEHRDNRRNMFLR